jgi:hypothetical protein
MDVQELKLIGIAHSHPQGCAKLSGPDRDYFTQLLKNIQRDWFYAPLVHSSIDGSFKLRPYILNSDGSSVELTRFEIVNEEIVTITEVKETKGKRFLQGRLPLPRIVFSARGIQGAAILITKLFFIGWLIWITLQLSPSLVITLTKLLTNGTH